MRVTETTAPAKVILFGEHAVVYGRPAIAAPVTQVRASATVEDSNLPGVRLKAPDLGREYWLREARQDDPFARAVQVVVARAGLFRMPDLTISVRSTIPVASGLGSSASMAAAVIRALAQHLGVSDLATNAEVSTMTYEVERLLHGTPSGIDNTVVSFEQPVYFVRREANNQIETMSVAEPLRLLVADSGIASSTKAVVGDVRRQWQERKDHFEKLFDRCGQAARAARKAIERGEMGLLGQLMVQNHETLRELTVSSPELEELVSAALRAGALGAKLSGAGRGGNMIALVKRQTEDSVRDALLAAGARTVLTSVVA